MVFVVDMMLIMECQWLRVGYVQSIFIFDVLVYPRKYVSATYYSKFHLLH